MQVLAEGPYTGFAPRGRSQPVICGRPPPGGIRWDTWAGAQVRVCRDDPLFLSVGVDDYYEMLHQSLFPLNAPRLPYITTHRLSKRVFLVAHKSRFLPDGI